DTGRFQKSTPRFLLVVSHEVRLSLLDMRSGVCSTKASGQKIIGAIAIRPHDQVSFSGPTCQIQVGCRKNRYDRQ
ncbi:MAG TPA: hypothetical protein VE890_09865, partial [Thermoguttaceae bacterium]|nr:hypothetical protein [Thermoguttaceae bacterium]